MKSKRQNINETAERLNIQVENDQTIYKNRTLTPNLQQQAWKANSISMVTTAGKSVHYFYQKQQIQIQEAKQHS